MTDENMDLRSLLEKTVDPDFLRVAEDDPVLTVVLLDEALVADLCERIEGVVRASEGRVNAAVLQQTALAKQALAETVSAGAEHLAAEVRRPATYLDEVLKEAAAEHVEAAAQAAGQARRFMRIAVLVAGLLVGLLAGITLAMSLFRFF